MESWSGAGAVPSGVGHARLLDASGCVAAHAARRAILDSTRLTRLFTILNDPTPLNQLLDRVLTTLSTYTFDITDTSGFVNKDALTEQITLYNNRQYSLPVMEHLPSWK